MEWLNRIGYIFSIVLCAVLPLALLYRKKKGKAGLPGNSAACSTGFLQKISFIRSKTSVRYLVAVLMLAGIAVRVWKFGLVPAGFNQDGAMGAVDALALAEYGTDRFGMWLPAHFTAWGYGQMSVLLSYLTVPFIWIFGLSRITARLPILIISILGMWVVYRLCRLFFGEGAAVTALAFCAISPWHIMQSRWAIDCNMLPHFFLFSVYFMCLSAERRRTKSAEGGKELQQVKGPKQQNKSLACLCLSMALFGLTMYTYGIAWFAVPLFLAAAAVYFVCRRIFSIKALLVPAAVFLLVAWPAAAVAVINMFELKGISLPFVTIPYFPETTRTSDILFFGGDVTHGLLSNLKQFVNVVILQKPGLSWNSIPGYGAVYIFSIPFLAAGIIVSVSSGRTVSPDHAVSAPGLVQRDHALSVQGRVPQNNPVSLQGQVPQNHKESPLLSASPSHGRVLLLIWLAVACLMGVIINGVNVNRINIIFYPVIIFTAAGIYYAISRIRPAVLMIALLYILAFTSFSSAYFGEHSEVLASDFYHGFGEALEYAAMPEYDNAEIIYVTAYTQNPESYGVSEILTLFHHKTDALYFQGKADAYASDGRKLLPYKERYRYIKIASHDIDPHENAVYIVRDSEAEAFSDMEFIIKYFGRYCAIVPEHLAVKNIHIN
ncbi:MAG: glycosyltransferase family 39 protein [Eubacteriales bacterium]|nr:glycosyltransferase family 39 protein [Eubacteriales bacterium]